nr:hypothetical protein [Tanacetum cinerariifolium]
MDSLQLIDLSKEDDCLLPLSFRDTVEDVKLSCAVGFDNESMIKRSEMGPVERRRLVLTYAGLLNPEELSMINKVSQKTSRSCQPSFHSRKDVKPDIHKRSKVPINHHGLAPNQVVMEHRTRKAGAGSTLSNRSHGDFSSKLTSFTTLKTKMSKAQAVSKGSMHKLNQIEASTLRISAKNCLKVKKLLSREHDGRKVGARGSKPESNGQIHNEMLKSLKNDSISFKRKVVIDIEKTQEDSDQCSLQESQKEDMCTYEDKVNGLSSHLESIGLDRYAEVKSQGSCAKRGQPFLETSRPSLLRSSLDWDSAFITGAGRESLAEANSNQPSYGTQNDGRPHQVSGQNQTLLDSDGFHLETLESDLPKYVNPDIHIKNKAKKGLKDDIVKITTKLR